MAISKIQYENKEKTQDDPDKPRKNKITDEDLNEIKEIVNNNADELINAQNALIEDEKNIKQLQTDNTQNKKDISNIKTEQTEQNNRLSDLEVDNTKQKSDIKNLKEDVDELYKDNTINKQEISKLKSVLGVETEEAKSLHVENADIIGNLKIKGNIEKDGEASLSNPVYLNTLGSNADGSFKGSTEIKISNGTDTKSFVLPIQKEMLTEDYFVKESDGWKEVHNWTKIIFDGTENWTVSFNIPGSTHKGNPYFVKIEREAIYDENQYCSHCSKCSYKGEEEGSFAATQNYFYFNPDDSEIASLSDLKDWLVQQNHNGKPLTAWYKCEEYKIACTDEQTTILDQLSNLDLYKGVDNITTTENIALLKLYYVTDIKSEQAQQNMNIENLQKENAELKAENERLRQDLKAFPSGQAEGEYITLKDSADSRFNMFRVGGNSKQETREGYNLANLDSESYTTVGVTVTNNGDGSFTLNGTTNGAGDINLTKNVDINKTIYDFENADYLLKTIVESGSFSNPNNLLVQTACVGKIGEINSFELLLNQLSKNIFSQVIARNTNCHLSKIEIYIGGAGIVFNNYRIKVLLAKSNDTNLAWEPYGASPSPEYPSEIQNIEGNINVTVCNKNLCYKSIIQNNDNVNFYFNTKSIAKEVAISFIVDKSLKGNSIYCKADGVSIGRILAQVTANANSKANAQIIFTDEEYEKVKNANEVYFQLYKAGANFETISDPMIENSPTATNYVSHQEQNFTFPLQEGQRLMLGDYLAEDGIHHVRKQFVVDGTEKIFSVELLSTGYIRFNFYKIGCTGTYGGATTIRFCSIFKNDELKRWDILTQNANIIGIASYTDQLKLVMKNVFGITESDSLEDMTTKVSNYLKENNFTVEEVVDEYVEAYTPEQQKAYNEIVQTAKSYKNVTNIYSPDPVSPVFSINYRKDIDAYIDNKLANVNAQILNIAGGN